MRPPAIEESAVAAAVIGFECQHTHRGEIVPSASPGGRRAHDPILSVNPANLALGADNVIRPLAPPSPFFGGLSRDLAAVRSGTALAPLLSGDHMVWRERP